MKIEIEGIEIEIISNDTKELTKSDLDLDEILMISNELLNYDKGTIYIKNIGSSCSWNVLKRGC